MGLVLAGEKRGRGAYTPRPCRGLTQSSLLSRGVKILLLIRRSFHGSWSVGKRRTKNEEKETSSDSLVLI